MEGKKENTIRNGAKAVSFTKPSSMKDPNHYISSSR